MSRKENDTLTAQDFLIFHLKNVGYMQDDNFEIAFRNTPIEKIVGKKEVSSFCLDNPVPFYSFKDVERPIPAPHMICAMLQELNIQEHSNVLILGSDGGFIPTIISKIAKKGKITVVEQNEAAFKVTKQNFQKLETPNNINLYLMDPLDSKKTGGCWDRILVTGCIPDIPYEMREWVSEGGVIVAPVGGGEQVMVRAVKRESGKFSEEIMGSVIFIKLESDKAKKIKSRRVETEDLNEFKKSFIEDSSLKSFPFPIAYVVRSFFRTKLDPHSRFTRLLDIFDVMIRFLTIIVICDLIAKDYKNKISEIINNSKLNVYKPTLGTWVGVLRELCNNLYNKIEGPFMPELKKSIPISIDKMNSLVEARNKHHGHAFTLRDDDYQELVEKYEPIINELLRSFLFLKEYTFLICDNMKYVDSKFNLSIRNLTGPHPEFATDELQSKNQIECGKASLWRNRDEKNLILDPLIVLQKCPTCKNREVFFYHSTRDGKIEYHEFQYNHELCLKGNLAAFF